MLRSDLILTEHGLNKANIDLDRKALAEIAYHDADAFKAIVAKVK